MSNKLPIDINRNEITSLQQLGSFSTVSTVADMNLGDKYFHKFVVAVSEKYTDSALHGAGEAPIVFLLIDLTTAQNVQDGTAQITKEEYAEQIRQIRNYIAETYNARATQLKVSSDLILNAIKARSSEAHSKQRNETEKRIDALLLAAHKGKASDIHISCGDRAGDTKIKFRIDGELVLHGTEGNQDSISDLVSVLYSSLAAEDGAIKGLSFDSKIKNDAVIYRTVENMRLGARIASHPTEKKDKNFLMVLRVLGDQNANAQRVPFSELGFLYNQSLKVSQALYGKGIVLIIGETNSGKSVTMQNMLMEIDETANGTRNILSIENPVERQIKGVNQFNLIDSGATTTTALSDAFNAAMEFIVRADPDDVAVGEIRDESTCQASQQLALTGHNVLATMHCDSPFDVFERMIGLGASEKQLLSGETMKAVISQKLFKKLCSSCSYSPYGLDTLNPLQHESIRQIALMGMAHKIQMVRFRNSSGCEKCNNRGIKDRKLVAEVVEYNYQILQALANSKKLEAKKIWLDNSGFSKKDIALACVFAGYIDPTDVIEQLGDLTETYFLRKKFGLPHPMEIYT
ncbi:MULTISPECIES: GspE/PulE family protein [Vibrio]|uniref:GspE/PulE family protein n=1 Tax=Vibrio TaxID=662 RepID=UPI0004DF5FC5|nr:ATPase, T2SS/T4P/T4SS family [Vibrio parahaemolyticus]HAS6026417.1 ATP-binding protein [Vibrio vulnificus]HAS6035790.1 ATP-binding protein [Vibrio vulnificus]HDY7428883.1 Flp pilus assembly complex ATPase component TadA [Vibrio vulnificus]HDY7488550.1 Flp pilus assembly complex ATPase component TadA [Vibrio vulnificus]HDY7951679.1 Flp pilus assembly complex ATPase component TadA [Vibrio vulnificus]